jgi:hypothetical protein
VDGAARLGQNIDELWKSLNEDHASSAGPAPPPLEAAPTAVHAAAGARAQPGDRRRGADPQRRRALPALPRRAGQQRPPRRRGRDRLGRQRRHRRRPPRWRAGAGHRGGKFDHGRAAGPRPSCQADVLVFLVQDAVPLARVGWRNGGRTRPEWRRDRGRWRRPAAADLVHGGGLADGSAAAEAHRSLPERGAGGALARAVAAPAAARRRGLRRARRAVPGRGRIPAHEPRRGRAAGLRPVHAGWALGHEPRPGRHGRLRRAQRGARYATTRPSSRRFGYRVPGPLATLKGFRAWATGAGWRCTASRTAPLPGALAPAALGRCRPGQAAADGRAAPRQPVPRPEELAS